MVSNETLTFIFLQFQSVSSPTTKIFKRHTHTQRDAERRRSKGGGARKQQQQQHDDDDDEPPPPPPPPVFAAAFFLLLLGDVRRFCRVRDRPLECHSRARFHDRDKVEILRDE